MIKRSVRQLDLRTEDGTTFVRLIFDDDSDVELKGPRSGLKIKERTEGKVIIYDCEFNGFQLA